VFHKEVQAEAKNLRLVSVTVRKQYKAFNILVNLKALQKLFIIIQ